MQVVFFFLALITILLFAPYSFSVQVVLDSSKQKGGIKIKLFGLFTIFRLIGVVKENVLKLYSKKNKYIFIEIADVIANALSNTQQAPVPTWLLKSLKVDELIISTECGLQNSIYYGGALNILSGILYAVIKNLTPNCRLSISTNVRQNSPVRLAAVGIITLKPANIILKRKRYGTTKAN